MPIGASAGTLDIENATLRSNAIAVLTNLVTGNDAVRSSGAPTLEVYGDPSNGGNEARLELVSNLSVENSKSFTRLTSNAGVFSIQSGTDGTTNGPITFGGFSNERMRITADGNVGVGTTNPGRPLEIAAGGGGAILNIKRTDAGSGQGAIGFVNMNSNVCASITSARSGAEGGQLIFFTAPNDTTQTSDNPYLINERMRITADGNVGIGTTNPIGVNGGRRLEGLSTTGFEYIATRDDATSSAGDFIGAYLFKNTDASGTEPHYAGIAAKDPVTFGRMDLHFYTGRDNYENDTPQMVIDQDGNVGIGTTNPTGFEVYNKSINQTYRNDFTNIFVNNKYQIDARDNSAPNTISQRYGVRAADNAGLNPNNAELIVGAYADQNDPGADGGFISFNDSHKFHITKHPDANYGEDVVQGSNIDIPYIGSDTENLLIPLMTIQPNGNVGIGITNPPENLTVQDSGIEPTFGLRRKTYNDYAVYMKNTTGNFLTVTTSDDTVLNVGKGSGSDRSINALGTINASGNDYAEYMKKSRSDLVIQKGDIIGINNDGELTNVFSESIQFVVKSTNPSYVGGDSWNQGTINAPKYPSVMLRVDEYSNISSQDANLYTYWEEQNLYANTEQLNVYYEENEKYLEDRNLHRDPYDRIAFCGQVPVNVYNATPGQYVIPKQTDDDTISYELTDTPTFEQYQISIGKVIKIQEDGRAFIIVKIS
jgi:hypothetical protein